MGQSETKYLITSTVNETEGGWEGLSAVITLGSHAVFPNGLKYEFIRFNNGLRITEGPHKGFYDMVKVNSTPPRFPKN